MALLGERDKNWNIREVGVREVGGYVIVGGDNTGWGYGRLRVCEVWGYVRLGVRPGWAYGPG